ncbi:hypothetical protein [Spirosoma endophyticum]|uniref:Uncharacterized protein n=1 Tax=Spirosoma endophyticum TaxID=662367 RepID=A0A1I2I6H9_9BACT|nr:hypothetical protein [Spirosoma endophyticum]SFF36506.1 hypothetical protein SAMN05216167_15515 [Spirosoma endophyticum]
MKPKTIRFFSPQDNALAKPTKTKKGKEAKPIKLEGYISPTGKLVFPAKTIDQLEFQADSARFQIGTDQGKRKIKTIYLVPTQDDQDESFTLLKAAKSYIIDLAFILQKGGIAYKTTKYLFSLSPFPYQEGVIGYSLALQTSDLKPAYTGKPRGRKPKVTNQED